MKRTTMSYAAGLSLTAIVLAAATDIARAQETPESQPGVSAKYQSQLGAGHKRIRREKGKVFVWAGPREHPPEDEKALWYDFTGAPFPPEELQFGIGLDTIRPIDDPLFVDPDDERLLKNIRPSPYRRDERPQANIEIPVIGVVNNGEARAYPIALLDGHELVNDSIGGKPVTVGW